MQRLANEGTDYSQFIRDLLRHLRQLFLLQHLEDVGRATRRRCAPSARRSSWTASCSAACCQRAGQVSPREVVHFIETLGEAQREIRDGLDPRLQLELALVKVTRPQLDHSRPRWKSACGAWRRGPAAAAAAPARQVPRATDRAKRGGKPARPRPPRRRR